MIIDYGLGAARMHAANANPPGLLERIVAPALRFVARLICGLQGHLILLHFEPHRLSLQCALCGYQSEGWEVGRVRVSAGSRKPRDERRRALRALDQGARLAS